MQTLPIDKSNLSSEEIKIERAFIEGTHEGIKRVIYEIEWVQAECRSLGYDTIQLESLRNRLGVIVYNNWPRKD